MNDITDILKDSEPKRIFRRRHGKIGRMTPELREFVNRSLLEGYTYTKIITLLEERGHTGIKSQNIVAWAKGGYQDWLREREEAAQFRARCESIVAIYASLPPETRAQMGDINKFAMSIQLNEILSGSKTGGVSDLITKKPENFFNLANYVTTQSSEETRRKRLDLESKKFEFRLAKLGLAPMPEISEKDKVPQGKTS